MEHGKIKLKNLLGDKKTKKYIILFSLVILVIIIALDILPEKKNKSEIKTDDDYVFMLETNMEKLLSETAGVGDCDVMITVLSTSESVYATENQDKNTNTVSDNKTQTDINTKKTVKTVGNEPVLEKSVFPEICGVVIICKGGDNSGVKATVTAMASTLLGISKDKIVVSEKR